MENEKIYEDGEYAPGEKCGLCKDRGVKEKRLTTYNKKYDAFLCSEHNYYIEDILKGKY